MPPDKRFLLDIVAASEAIDRFLGRTDRTTFFEDELFQSAIL